LFYWTKINTRATAATLDSSTYTSYAYATDAVGNSKGSQVRSFSVTGSVAQASAGSAGGS
jgi:hypothetical protein